MNSVKKMYIGTRFMFEFLSPIPYSHCIFVRITVNQCSVMLSTANATFCQLKLFNHRQQISSQPFLACVGKAVGLQNHTIFITGSKLAVEDFDVSVLSNFPNF